MSGYVLALVVGTMLERQTALLPLSPLTMILSLAGGAASGFLYYLLAPLRRTGIAGYRLTWIFSAALFGVFLAPLISVTDPKGRAEIPKWVIQVIGAATGGLMGLAVALGGEKYRAYEDLELEDVDDATEYYGRAVEEEKAFLRRQAGHDQAAADMLAAVDEDEITLAHAQFLQRVADKLRQKAGEDPIARHAVQIAETSLEVVRTDAQRLGADPNFADELRRRNAELDVAVAAELEKEAQKLRDKALADPGAARRLANLEKLIMELRGTRSLGRGGP